MRGPAVSLTSIKTYFDGTATTQTVGDFYIEGAGGIRPSVKIKSTSDSVDDDFTEVEVTSTNGFGASASAVPSDIRHAVKIILAHLYDNRDEEKADGNRVVDLPWKADLILARYQDPVI